MKFCVKCGAEITDDTLFCPLCGTKCDTGNSNNAGNTNNNNVFYMTSPNKETSVASLVLGILGILIGFLLIPLVGLVLSTIGISIGAKKHYTVGIVVNILGFVASIAMIIINIVINPDLSGSVQTLLASLL